MSTHLVEQYDILLNGIVKEFCDKQGFDYSQASWIGRNKSTLLIESDTIAYELGMDAIVTDLRANAPKGAICTWYRDSDYTYSYDVYLYHYYNI